MIFWIDGHNLIGALPDARLSDPDDESQLLARLQQFAWRGRHRLVVFFDRGRGGRAELPPTPSIEVRFAPRGLSADDLIRAAIDGASQGVLQGVVVVTSDRALQNAARAAGARVQSSRSFAHRLQAHDLDDEESSGETEPELSPEENEALLRQFEARRRARDRTRRARNQTTKGKRKQGRPRKI